MIKQKVFFRADGNSEIGLGHVIRSLALAEMLKEDFDRVFATRFLTDYINTEARKVCNDIIKLPESDEHFDAFLSCLSGNEIVVLDNYFFDTDYQKAIKNKGCKLVCIDDIHDKHFVADVVINHAGGVRKESYIAAPYTYLFLGTDYALLRPEFLKREEKNDTFSLLICLGGADKENATLQILRLLEDKQFPHQCYVVVGDAFQYQQDLINFQQTSKLNIEILKNLSAQKMADIMSQCRYAICPPSTVSCEYLSKRGGELYLKLIADNQKDIYDFYLKNGIAFDVSELFVNDSLTVQRCIETQRKYFDGQSGERIRSIFRILENEQKLKLRKATINDAKLLFDWANDDEVRTTAVIKKKIEWEEHIHWFTNKLKSNQSHIFILTDAENEHIGVVRFDKEDDAFMISYSIDKSHRRKGMGLLILQLGCKKMREEVPNCTFKALVQTDNTASNKIFVTLGFSLEKIETVKEHIFNVYCKDGNK
ncbi:MAG: UDP-2,4-diacetamido-2,4,6-trideoxy-beta-L-altropyranose hydrolase [Tannerella sp.]|jgi:UDP-2,4-diacetamido-2,4,6-trideoxy-beta-L-altropyranose hydrolase|nr:UDP-2,4-diacetamido-2,4,6-trideoxy-beta-L-altropyranose hydrolase [Tannerella sp.]